MFSEELILHDGTDSEGNPASGVRHNRCHPVYCGYGGGEFVFTDNASQDLTLHTLSSTVSNKNNIECFFSIE